MNAARGSMPFSVDMGDLTGRQRISKDFPDRFFIAGLHVSVFFLPCFFILNRFFAY